MLAIRLLGEVEIVRAGERVPLPPSKKTRALLAYLALSGRAHRRQRLCSMFWDIPDDPRGALRWSLSKLRPIVDEPERPRILADRETVGLDTAGSTVDVVAVRQAVAGGVDGLSTERLEELARTFRGELLEGLDLPDLNDFQGWCVAEREDARRLHAQILMALATRLSDRPDEALPYARLLTHVDPFHEAARAMHLELLVALGRRTEAEQQFDAAMRLLREARVATAGLQSIWRALTEPGGARDGASSLPNAPAARADAPAAASTATTATAMPMEMPPVFGRAVEFGRLQAACDAAARGAGIQVLLIKGEPGLGKSMLIGELARTVRGRAGSVLLGRASEVERDQPFGPWSEALDGLPTALLDPTEPTTELERRGERESARERLFAAVVESLSSRATAAAPLLLAFEDIHWLDEASAALLHHAVRALRTAPVMVLLSARDGELPDNIPVVRVLRSLRHERLLDEIPLGPLSTADIAALARTVAPTVDAERVAVESGGNPLLAFELARALLAGGQAVPQTVHGLVRDRIERLPAAAADILPWAAVIGPRLSIDHLRALVPMPPMEFLSALETLERHALIAESGTDGDHYAFRHHLIHRAVYTGLSEPRRRLMHLKVAEMLEAIEPGDEAGATEIARHASLAGDHARAAAACVTAARRCLRLLAGTEAAALARRGMGHAERLREPDRTRYMLDLTHIQLAACRPDDAEAAVARIEELAERALDHGCLDHARLGFHMMSHLRWEGGCWSDAERDSLRAELVSRSADEKVRVVAMAEAARCLALLERDLGQAEAFTLEARAIAQRLGIEPDGIPDALGLLRLHQGEGDEAAALFARAREAARRDGERANEFLALEHLVVHEIRQGGFEQAEALCEEMSRLAGRLRDGSEAPFARAVGLLCRRARGDADAEAAFEVALSALTNADAKHRLAFTFNLAAELDLAAGRPERAADRAAESLRLASLVDLPSEAAIALATLAEAATASGDTRGERQHLAALEALLGRNLSHHARARAQALLATPRKRVARR